MADDYFADLLPMRAKPETPVEEAKGLSSPGNAHIASRSEGQRAPGTKFAELGDLLGQDEQAEQAVLEAPKSQPHNSCKEIEDAVDSSLRRFASSLTQVLAGFDRRLEVLEEKLEKTCGLVLGTCTTQSEALAGVSQQLTALAKESQASRLHSEEMQKQIGEGVKEVQKTLQGVREKQDLLDAEAELRKLSHQPQASEEPVAPKPSPAPSVQEQLPAQTAPVAATISPKAAASLPPGPSLPAPTVPPLPANPSEPPTPQAPPQVQGFQQGGQQAPQQRVAAPSGPSSQPQERQQQAGMLQGYPPSHHQPGFPPHQQPQGPSYYSTAPPVQPQFQPQHHPGPQYLAGPQPAKPHFPQASAGHPSSYQPSRQFSGPPGNTFASTDTSPYSGSYSSSALGNTQGHQNDGRAGSHQGYPPETRGNTTHQGYPAMSQPTLPNAPPQGPARYPAPAFSSQGSGGYPTPARADSNFSSQSYPRANPPRSRTPASGPSAQSVPLEQVIDDVANMGFSRHEVRTVIGELEEKGQAVDLNVVLDRLMNGPRR